MSRITERIERELGLPGLAATLADRLKPSDLQSLWLEISRRQADRLTPAEVLAAYERNRFVRPAALASKRLRDWTDALLSHLPADFSVLELSPVCPLGTNSAVAGVAQNWAVATERQTEVVSDATNVLALEAASRRKQARQAAPAEAPAVHLATCHRLLRAQKYEAAHFSPHFLLLGLCSAGRGGDFELSALALQVEFLATALRQQLPAGTGLRLALSDFGEPTRPAEMVADWLRARSERCPGLICETAPDRATGRGYYSGCCFHLLLKLPDGSERQIADGGAVAWAGRLLSDSKERMVISGLGLEGLATNFIPRMQST
ncbi:MAG TPA: hypothetical protein PLF88_03265 [Opitutaceae bacterium]|nr:hypothetical protein [Opitutaceae bacterium]HRJ46337.1 hypothetical protein [Opitutaceae bacterium]